MFESFEIKRRGSSVKRDLVKLEMWTLPVHFDEHGILEEMAKPTGHAGVWMPPHVSKNGGPIFRISRESDNAHQGSFSGELARVLQEAFEHMAPAAPPELSFRLLSVPSRGVEALWYSDREGKLYILMAPLSTGVKSGTVLTAQEFVRKLSRAPRVGVLESKRRPKFNLKYGRWFGLTVLMVFGIVAISVFIYTIDAAGGRSGASHHIDLTVPWLTFEVGLLAACLIAGYLSKKRVDGVLIDERNRLSLARFQGIVWFPLIISSYLTATYWNVAHGVKLPHAGETLWQLLGLAGAAPVVSQVILAPKANAPLASSPSSGTAQAQGFNLPPVVAPSGQPSNMGLLDANLTVQEASWADLYLGEEISNRNVVDVSRLQQLTATIALGICFGMLCQRAFAYASSAGVNMPTLDDGFVWLMGISSGAYLAAKATPKTLAPPG